VSVESLLGFGRVFGTHPVGFGDPFISPWQAVADPADGVVPDDGGVKVTVAGGFGAGVRHEVWVSAGSGWRRCYSGVSGQGWGCYPAADGSLAFVVPGGLLLGAHDVRIRWPGHTITRTAALTVVRRHRRAKSYEVARFFTRPFTAGRGPADPTQDVLYDDTSTNVEPLYGPLRAFKEAVADMGNRMGGLILTRLTRDLPPAPFGPAPPAEALEALVETTYGFPATDGTIACHGEVMAYDTAAGGSIAGLVRDDAVREMRPKGEPVVLWTRDVSDLDLARRALLVDTAEGDYLDVIGQNYGVPRYLDCPDEAYRRLIRALAFQAAKGSRTALEEVLALLLEDKGITLTDGVIDRATRTLTSASAPFTAGMLDLRVRLRGTGRNANKLVHIAEVVSTSVVRFSALGGLGWEPADLDDESGVAWDLIPYDVLETPYKPCTVIIRVVGAPPLDATGFGYIQGGEIVVPDNPNTVDVSAPIRQVLGVWLGTDTQRTGTNYATSNTFAGSTITLDTPLPVVDSVIVDYGAINAPDTAPTTGVPGRADGPATAQLLRDVNIRNPGDAAEVAYYAALDPPDKVVYQSAPPIERYPLYLGDRGGVLKAIFDTITVAGVIPELDVKTW
jgi:hypothetical protein